MGSSQESMQIKTTTLTILCLCQFFFQLGAQTFPCNGDFIISLYQKGVPPTQTHEINFDGTIVNFESLVTTEVVYNAMGFNSKDGFIYAVDRYNTDVIRIKSDGSFERIGRENDIPIWTTGAGDVSKLGYYTVDERTNFTLYFYDVVDGFEKVAQVQRTWHPSTGNIGVAELALDDFAYDPLDPNTIYSYQRAWPSAGFPNEPANSRGYLMTINADIESPEFGMTKVIAPVDSDIIIHLGALFFDTKGELYGYGSIIPGPFIQQKKLVRINKETGETTLIGEGPNASGADGCSCPYTLYLEKTIDQNFVTCADEYIQFDFKLGNNADRDFNELIFSDTFPAGMEILEIIPPQPLGVVASSGTGIGTEILHYANGKQAANASTSFSVRVKNPGVELRICNQANLQVPSSFGGTILSDDPSSNVFSDSSCVEIQAFDLSESEIIIEQPANCISQNDGSISIGSPQLNEGQSYQVNYLWDDIPIGPLSIVAGDGILVLEGLSPGIYTALCVKGEANDLCSTEIIGDFGLFVPLGLEQIQATGPSSFCLGDSDLMSLEATFIDGANYTWIGPDGFSANGASISLNEIILEQSGFFQVTAERDSCFSIDSVYVEIYPPAEIELSVDENSDPCEVVQLHFQSEAFLQNFIWSPSENLSCDSCTDPTIIGYTSGQFQLTSIDENGCEGIHTIDVENPLQKNYYIPNAFSPNADGINDRFTLFGNCAIQEIELMQIYDRWGMLHFEANSITPNIEIQGWDGLTKDKKLNPGNYVYLFKVLYLDGSEELISGDVTLLK